MTQPFRFPPVLPVTAVKTYAVSAPAEGDWWRKATCAEVDCEHHLNGWLTKVDESTDLGKQQAWYIRNKSGRRFTEDRNREPGLTLFVFEAGQACFAADKHRLRTGRPELFVVRDGDWRGNPTGNRRVHQRPEDWVDEFANHQQQLADQTKRG